MLEYRGMNEHQQRLWQRMINAIDSYLSEEDEDFFKLVGDLEGNLDASEIKDSILIGEWYDFWTSLEIVRAVALDEGNFVDKAEVIEDLEDMKRFLIKSCLLDS